MNGLRLIADIGGTNARFALARDGRYSRLSSVEDGRYDTLHDALADYLTVLPVEERSGLAAAIAIAAPVAGDQITMTNKTWSFSVEELKRSLNLVSLTVVNDFAATAQAIPHLAESERFVVGLPTSGKGNIGIVGPGTGLGMSALIPHGADWVLVAGEGGHATLAASTEEEFAILQILRKRWTHVSAERVLSGAGLVNLYEVLCSIEGVEPLMLTPADVTRRALHGSDNNCIKAFEYFCGFLGSVAGDLALTIGAFGGIYIAGGILLRFKEAFATSSFRQRFESKGRFSEMLERIPTYLILDESPALTGLANLPINT
ncbi:glucokinase [Bradyrhizobium canariense]|uniref:glucokinase n=1 Tax=Bradyrhizobium canariense TaxID=255045 RepID=UPI001FCCCE3F|nr:glucokinase [Bradyrhizobium canariense]